MKLFFFLLFLEEAEKRVKKMYSNWCVHSFSIECVVAGAFINEMKCNISVKLFMCMCYTYVQIQILC